MRIRHPKGKKLKNSKAEEKKHFTLQVHDSTVASPIKIGLGQPNTGK